MRFAPLTAGFGYVVTPDHDGEDPAAIDTAELRARLCERQGGLIMFRGFGGDADRFRAFTERFGQGFVVHHNVEGRDYVGEDRTFATVAKSNKPIDFHIEMASSPSRPDALWFFCVTPSADKGRIGFVDGIAALASLTGRTRQLLRDCGLRYEYRELPFDIWRPVWDAVNDPEASSRYVTRWLSRVGPRIGVSNCSVDAESRLSFDYRVACVYQARYCDEEVFACGLLDNPRRTLLGTGEPVPRAALIEVYQAVYQNAVWLDWRAGDLAVVDNTRVMHAREAFEDERRRVLVRYSALKG